MLKIIARNTVLLLIWQLIFCLNAKGFTENDYCVGQWGTFTPESKRFDYEIYASRLHMNLTNLTESSINFEAHACAAQVTTYTCYYLGNTTRAKELENRVFDATDKSCLRFEPLSFLRFIKGRKIIFYGDSLTAQLYQSILCSLYKNLSPDDYKLKVQFGHLTNCNKITCPFFPESDKHSWFKSAYLQIKSMDVLIVYIWQQLYNKDSFLGLYDQFSLNSNDVIITNFGMWYFRPWEYLPSMTAMKNDVIAYYRSKRRSENVKVSVDNGDRHHRSLKYDRKLQETNPNGETDKILLYDTDLPVILFFETIPQHFPGRSGRWERTPGPNDDCQPTTNYQDKYNSDTINRALDQIYPMSLYEKIPLFENSSDSSNSSRASGFPIYLVHIAEALYSQYDAHVGLVDPQADRPLDCSHWCFPSNIHKYYHRKLYTILHHIAKNRVSSPSYVEGSNSNELLPWTNYPLIGGIRDGWVIKSAASRSIYLLTNRSKCEFQSWDAFVGRGYSMDKVITLDLEDIEQIPNGPGLF